MPIVRIDVLAGRTPERKSVLMSQVTEAVVAVLDVRHEQVRVLLNEVPPEDWAVGGRSITQPEPSERDS